MSVINRMLQELEARHEAAPPAGGFVRAVAPAPKPRRHWVWAVATVLVVVVLTAAAVGWLRGRPGTPPPATPAAQPQSTAKPPAPALKLEESVSVPAVAQTAESDTPVAAPAAGPRSDPPPPPEAPPAAPPRSEPVVSKTPPGTISDGPVAEFKRITPQQWAEQRYREGVALLAQGQRDAARARLREALAAAPGLTAARHALLALAIEDKAWPEAERLLDEGLALDPGSPRLIMAAARVQLEKGNAAQALATLESHLAQGERDADYRAFLAALLVRQGRHAEAVGHYQATLALDPSRAAAWLGLGLSLEALGRKPEAAAALERARSLPGLSSELKAFIAQRLAQLAQP